MDEDQDFELIRRSLEGEPRAFETVIEKYQRMVLNLAYRIVNNSEDAKDIAQAVLIKAYGNLASFDPQHKFFSWLYRIAINESLNFTKKRKRQAELRPRSLALGIDPQDALANNELRQKIENALARLSPRERALVALGLDGFSYKEIGELLDLSENKVKARLFTARHKIKDILEKNGITAHGR
jgi:RNA polymerase sigma-70 factor (ECF subfamily)